MSFEFDVARKLTEHGRRIRRLEILPSGSDPAAASSGAPVDGPYIVATTNATLTGERTLLAGSGLSLTDQGANASLYIDALAGPGLDFLSGSLFAVASDITASLVEGTISASLDDNYGPASGTYITISGHTDLTAERILQAGSGLLLTDQGAEASVFLDIDAGSGLEFDGNQLELSDHSHNSGSITDFDEAAQDAVGNILIDTGSIEFTYDDGTPAISACVNPGGVSHDGLADVSEDDHHTAFIGLLDNAGASVNPRDSDDRIGFTDDGIVNVDESGGSNVALSVNQSQIEASAIGMQWNDWTPTVVQNSTVSACVPYARYTLIGQMAIVQCLIEVTGDGASGNRVEVNNLPASAANTNNDAAAGAFTVNAIASTLRYAGTAIMREATGISLRVNETNAFFGADPDYKLVDGTEISFSVMYEIV